MRQALSADLATEVYLRLDRPVANVPLRHTRLGFGAPLKQGSPSWEGTVTSQPSVSFTAPVSSRPCVAICGPFPLDPEEVFGSGYDTV